MLACNGEARQVPGGSVASAAEMVSSKVNERDSTSNTVRWRTTQEDTQCQPLAITATHQCNMHATHIHKANISSRMVKQESFFTQMLPSSSRLESVLITVVTCYWMPGVWRG